MSCYIQHTLQKLDLTINDLGELHRGSPFLLGFIEKLQDILIRVMVEWTKNSRYCNR